jgi:REP element-mobilizing transposase RayT
MSDSAHFSRHTLRFRDRDYRSASSYFVTLCAHSRQPLFGVIDGERMELSALGEVVEAEWSNCERLRRGVRLGAFVVMPDHMHGILHLDGSSRIGTAVAGSFSRPSGGLGSLIAGVKAACTSQINLLRGTPGARVWQRNYRESYIRSGIHLKRATRYIERNPAEYQGPHRRPSP